MSYQTKKAKPGDPITARERQVLDLIALGHSNKIIADALGISEHTAKFHLNQVMLKLGARNRTQAAVVWDRRNRATFAPEDFASNMF